MSPSTAIADRDGSARCLQEQAGACRLLSRLLARPPDAELLADAARLGLLEAGLCHDGVAPRSTDPCYAVGFDEARAFRGGESAAGWETRLEAIQVEFTRLFSAPGSDAIPVHQSVYTDTLRLAPAEENTLIDGASFAGGEYPGYLGGPSCQEARRWYAASGFEPPALEMPDHISVQLDFMAHLLLAEAQAFDEGRADDAEAWRERRVQFRSRFLDRWLGTFAAKVVANPSSEFYRRVGRCLADFQSVIPKNGAQPPRLPFSLPLAPPSAPARPRPGGPVF